MDGGFATRSPPAQATKYGPADLCVVLGVSPVSFCVSKGVSVTVRANLKPNLQIFGNAATQGEYTAEAGFRY